MATTLHLFAFLVLIFALLGAAIKAHRTDGKLLGPFAIREPSEDELEAASTPDPEPRWRRKW